MEYHTTNEFKAGIQTWVGFAEKAIAHLANLEGYKGDHEYLEFVVWKRSPSEWKGECISPCTMEYSNLSKNAEIHQK